MCLIEQDQAVLAQQAGVHRLHPIRDAVAAEQEPRTHLVDGGAQDGRLRRGTRPVVLQWHTAAQPLRHQRRLVAAGEPLQPPRDFGDHAAASLRAPRRVAQDGGDPLGATIGVVDHQAPIHHQDNPQRCTAPRAVRLQRQMEHRNIERCRLAAAGRQVQHVRPPVITRELLDEPLHCLRSSQRDAVRTLLALPPPVPESPARRMLVGAPRHQCAPDAGREAVRVFVGRRPACERTAG